MNTGPAAYDTWTADPTPDNLYGVVRELNPAIQSKLAALGVSDDPRMRAQAKLFAAEAVKTYDPRSGASLPTWVQNNLQSMQRFKRMHSGPTTVPDRVALDAWAIEKATRAHLDETGEEPDVVQLADRVKMPISRIEKVRRSTRSVGSDAQAFETAQGEDYAHQDDALRYIHEESDGVDRKLIEMTTGYGGGPKLAKNEIAQRLKLSPAMVTRRTAVIAEKLAKLESELENTFS